MAGNEEEEQPVSITRSLTNFWNRLTLKDPSDDGDTEDGPVVTTEEEKGAEEEEEASVATEDESKKEMPEEFKDPENSVSVKHPEIVPIEEENLTKTQTVVQESIREEEEQDDEMEAMEEEMEEDFGSTKTWEETAVKEMRELQEENRFLRESMGIELLSAREQLSEEQARRHQQEAESQALKEDLNTMVSKCATLIESMAAVGDNTYRVMKEARNAMKLLIEAEKQNQAMYEELCQLKSWKETSSKDQKTLGKDAKFLSDYREEDDSRPVREKLSMETDKSHQNEGERSGPRTGREEIMQAYTPFRDYTNQLEAEMGRIIPETHRTMELLDAVQTEKQVMYEELCSLKLWKEAAIKNLRLLETEVHYLRNFKEVELPSLRTKLSKERARCYQHEVESWALKDDLNSIVKKCSVLIENMSVVGENTCKILADVQNISKLWEGMSNEMRRMHEELCKLRNWKETSLRDQKGMVKEINFVNECKLEVEEGKDVMALRERLNEETSRRQQSETESRTLKKENAAILKNYAVLQEYTKEVEGKMCKIIPEAKSTIELLSTVQAEKQAMYTELCGLQMWKDAALEDLNSLKREVLRLKELELPALREKLMKERTRCLQHEAESKALREELQAMRNKGTTLSNNISLVGGNMTRAGQETQNSRMFLGTANEDSRVNFVDLRNSMDLKERTLKDQNVAGTEATSFSQSTEEDVIVSLMEKLNLEADDSNSGAFACPR